MIFFKKKKTTHFAFIVYTTELDRKKEKSLVKSQVSLLVEQLTVANDPTTVLHQASLLMYARAHRALLHVPPENVSVLLELLHAAIDTDTLDALLQHQQLVEDALQVDESSSPEAFQALEKAKANVESLRRKVLEAAKASNKKSR